MDTAEAGWYLLGNGKIWQSTKLIDACYIFPSYNILSVQKMECITTIEGFKLEKLSNDRYYNGKWLQTLVIAFLSLEYL